MIPPFPHSQSHPWTPSAPYPAASARACASLPWSRCALSLAASHDASAQTARKPSPYEMRLEGPPIESGPDDPKAPAYLDRIGSREDFMRLARVYNPGTPLEMPHLIFVIDRRQANRIYYINTPRYVLHEVRPPRGPGAQAGQGHADLAVQGSQAPLPVRHAELAARPARLHL